MFGLGFFEIILILVGILIFVRPKDLPNFVYRVGKIYGQIKEAYNKFYREINLIKNQMDEMVEKTKKLEITKDKKEEGADKTLPSLPNQEIQTTKVTEPTPAAFNHDLNLSAFTDKDKRKNNPKKNVKKTVKKAGTVSKTSKKGKASKPVKSKKTASPKTDKTHKVNNKAKSPKKPAQKLLIPKKALKKSKK